MAELRDLVVDEQEFDRSEMTDGLMGYVRLGSGGQLRPGELWDSLPERAKVVAVLLAFKAAAALELRADESSSALEIAQASGVAHGTVRPVLRSLLELHLLQQPSRGMYSVQAMRVSQALGLLTVTRDSNGK